MNNVLGQTDVSQLTPGQIIKAAREAKQISISDVAHRLLLSKQVIAALEEDDYSKISAKVYAEGYLKSYAQFLQIPAETVLLSFRRLNIYPDTEIRSETNSQMDQSLASIFKVKHKYAQFTLLGFFVVLGILILFVFKSPGNKSTEGAIIPNLVNDAAKSSDTKVKSEQPLAITNDVIDNAGSKSSHKNNAAPSPSIQDVNKSLTIDLPPEESAEKNVTKSE